jgi:predicted permease
MRLHVWIRSVFRSWFRKRELDRDLDDELGSCLRMLVEEKVRAGMDPNDAARQARIELGGVEQVKERVRERRLGVGLDTLAQDVRYAFRTLRKNAGLTAVAALILAIGIGANTALFSTVHAVLLRGAPFPESGRLVIGLKTWKGLEAGSVSRVDYFDYREQGRSFTNLAALTTFLDEETVTGGGDAELVEASYVTWNLFTTLGVAPVVGRTFTSDEEARGDAPSVVISLAYAQHRFGGADSALGATLVLDGEPLTVVGVMPRGFRFLFDADLWRLIDRNGPFDEQRDSHSHIVVGRLQRGVTLAQAQAEADGISARLAAEYPESNTGKGLVLRELQSYMVRNVRTSLLLLIGTTVAVLLIACGNVAGLLLARGEQRQSEIAVRSALGASRGRMLRQLMTESVMLTVGAGLLGVLVAYLLQGLLLRLLPVGDLGVHPPAVNAAALAFTLIVSIATGLLVGVVPAFRSTSLEPARQLRSDVRATAGAQRGHLRNGLVVVQVALSVALLIASGLLVRSMMQLSRVDLGFDADHLLTGQIQVQVTDYPTPEQRAQFFSSLLEDVQRLPGVEAATLINKLPIRSRWQNWSVRPAEAPRPLPVESFSAMARWVTPGYFQTMHIPLLSGRDISTSDVRGSPFVVVVSRKVAETLFPGAEPIGRRVNIADWVVCQIVGVVGDARVNTLRGEPDATMYLAASQLGPAEMQIAVRTSGDPSLLIGPIEALLRGKNRNVLFARPQPMRAVVAGDAAGLRTVMLSLTLFACVAVILSAVAIYGVLAYHASQRKREFGLRLALGASAGEVVQMILRRGLVLVALGLVAGLAVAYPGTLLMRQLVYGIQLLDPGAYVGAVALLGVVAALACYLPARRAARGDIVDVLRTE